MSRKLASETVRLQQGVWGTSAQNGRFRVLGLGMMSPGITVHTCQHAADFGRLVVVLDSLYLRTALHV